MAGRSVVGGGSPAVVLLDSISYVGPADAGMIIVSGSHGGRAAAEYALSQPLAAVFFNDAGVGKERAGVVALDLLEARQIPAAAVAHTSARIGEAADTWVSGLISYVNPSAAARGLRPGMSVRAAVARLRGAALA